MAPMAIRTYRSLPFGNRLFWTRAMGSITARAMENLKKSREWVLIPEVYTNFPKMGMAPNAAAEININPIPMR